MHQLFGAEVVCIFCTCIVDEKHIMLAAIMRDGDEWLDTRQTGMDIAKPGARRMSA